MKHIKPTAKGDPLCPLGFHPQVRWPTRCKRCFRDYKEHGNRNKQSDATLRRDDTTASTPALSSWTLPLKSVNDRGSSEIAKSWTSSSNLNSTENDSKTSNNSNTRFSKSSSWMSTPDLASASDDNKEVASSVTLTRRRRPEPTDTGQDDAVSSDYRSTQFTVRRRTSNSSLVLEPEAATTSTTTTNNSLRTRNTYANSVDTPTVSSLRSRVSSARSYVDNSSPPNVNVTVHLKAPKSSSEVSKVTSVNSVESSSSSSASGSSSSDEDDYETVSQGTDTTIIADPEYQNELQSLRQELEIMRGRCEKAELEKNDLLLKRLASMDTSSSKTTASELLKFQQKVNELKTMVEDLQDEKKVLTTRCRELDVEVQAYKKKGFADKETEVLRNKLSAAESLCEELMDENEEMKRELREMEVEMDEMQDHFREDQADEYSSLKKELEQTAKNCRILSFKLRKTERRADQMEAEKMEAEKKYREIAGEQDGMDKVEKIKKLEKELSLSTEVVNRLQKDLDEANSKLKELSSGKSQETRKKAPTLASLNRNSSGEKISRESLTRGGSQDDPVQLLRDLQDSLEREADLREQLRNAEEEANSLRKKVSRVEDDNESLVLQLKKMATKARTRRHSPNSVSRLSAESANEKDEGISDEEDPAELRLLLELNEQEAAVLRRKVEDLESEGDGMKKKIADLQEKLLNKSNSLKKEKKAASLKSAEPKTDSSSTVYDKKLKVLEEEINELRKKLIEKERDCERLHSELALTKKKPKTLQKSISLDGASESIDLKRQLQNVEQEASILRTKNQTLEMDYEKLLAENKKLQLSKGSKKGGLVNSSQFELKGKIAALEKELEEANKKIQQFEGSKNGSKSSNDLSEVDKLKSQISKLESEKSILKRLKEDPVTDSVKLYLKRTPKKPTDLMAKSQLKKMVEDLENEISEILVVLQKSDVASAKVLESGKSDVEKTRLKKEVEELKKNLEATKREVIDQKAKFDKEKEKLSTEKKNIENDRKKIENLLEQEKKKLESEKQVIEAAKKKLELDKTELNAEITRLNSEIKALTTNTQEKGKQFESLNKQLEAEKKSVEILRQNLEGMKALEEENNKLKKELKDISQKSAEYEIKLKELEDKHKKSEKLLSAKKEKVSKLEKQLEEAVSARKSLESSQTKISADFQIEKDELLKKVEQLSTEKEDLSLEMQRKQGNIISLEKQLKEEKEKFINLSSKADATVSAELKRTREELTLLKKQNIDLHTKLAEAENIRRTAEENLKLKDKEMRKEIHQWELKASELELDLQSERKMKDRMKISYEQENKCKEAEISNLHNKMSQQGLNRRLSEVRLEYDKQLEKVEQSLTEERKNYEELTAKYEQLEQEHVATKSQFVMEKETLLSRLAVNEQEARSLESELRALRETYNKKQDEWIKEKLEIQERVKALERNQEKATDSDILQIQLNTLNATLNEKLSEIDQLQRENSMKLNQLENVKKENEELKKKLEDYVKVSKVQRSMSADSSALDRELREVKNRLYMEERARKSDLSALKLRYDSRIQIIMEELKNAQGQVSRFKRESDNYRHMFESAQKTIADLKGGARGSTRSSEQGEDIEEQVTALEQQLSLLEDELSEARLEGSRLKTELISNKSAFEVKVSEMASRINELEEERLLSSGRAKIPGLKTKLELAWSKEREEQQRILQETSTLARDLRQTLFEMERERDKDRLEAKRKNELLRKTMEEEQEENKRKITELQCDLLELRDAHAKLRTTNEKLRREKERFDQEKETLRKIKSSLLEDPKLSRILDLCNELTAMIPELTGKPNTTIGLVTPPVRRKGPKSRESSPSLEKAVSSRESSMARDDPRVSRMQVIMQQLSEITHDLRRSQRMSEDDKRALFSRRSASTESENPTEPPSYRKGVQRRGSLYRKSLSLEQTSQSVMAANEKIWKMEDDNGSYSSFQSLDEAPEPKFNMYQQIDSSLDSRLSGDSTQSERVGAGEKKKKKGILGKLRKLTKSSSVDHEPEYEYTSRSQVNPGSDTSLASHGNPELESHQNKRNFKSRISDMFKKSGSTSRGNSMERTMGLPPSGSSVMSDSAMRPLTRTSPSPARSDVSSSSASRPLIGSNGKPMTAPGSVPLPRKVNNKK
ncbi:unnamed protein product [Bemisia tabaci]|uniref:Uncharacterized protein n=1 Tax=Bemisia tabaci TaxID=7038 RepID=A0A9P0F556_BEMTA|nr:unnamed protein product [Bemisia tabaci]